MRATSFQDYAETLARENLAYKAKRAGIRKYVEYTGNGDLDLAGHTGKEAVVKTNEETFLKILVSINKNLERLADAWEAHPVKTGFLQRVMS
jgi:hypothetical protein